MTLKDQILALPCPTEVFLNNTVGGTWKAALNAAAALVTQQPDPSELIAAVSKCKQAEAYYGETWPNLPGAVDNLIARAYAYITALTQEKS